MCPTHQHAELDAEDRGANFELPAILEPLAPVRDDVLVLTD